MRAVKTDTVLKIDFRGRATRPIDMMHLAKQALGDPGLELEILRAYSETMARHVDRLEQSTTVPDLLHNLHTIKGASVGVGAWSLAEHAHVMTTELNAGEPVNPERVEDIRMAVEEVQTFIADRIARAEAMTG
jgi:chemotaxis protein histidine kinase CheA